MVFIFLIFPFCCLSFSVSFPENLPTDSCVCAALSTSIYTQFKSICTGPFNCDASWWYTISIGLLIAFVQYCKISSGHQRIWWHFCFLHMHTNPHTPTHFDKSKTITQNHHDHHQPPTTKTSGSASRIEKCHDYVLIWIHHFDDGKMKIIHRKWRRSRIRWSGCLHTSSIRS